MRLLQQLHTYHFNPPIVEISSDLLKSTEGMDLRNMICEIYPPDLNDDVDAHSYKLWRDGDLRGVIYRGTIVYYANLEGLDLSGSDFAGVSFKNCNLIGTIFSYANLEGVCFAYCRIEGADFQYANLKDSTFRWGVDGLLGTSAQMFEGADLRGSNIILYSKEHTQMEEPAILHVPRKISARNRP